MPFDGYVISIKFSPTLISTSQPSLSTNREYIIELANVAYDILTQKQGCMRETVDDNVKHTVKNIFEDLRQHQPMKRTRKSDRINKDRLLQELSDKEPKRK